MSGYMVATHSYEVKSFYMVNEPDPDRACEQVIRAEGSKIAQALTPLSDETLAHFNVLPNEPWKCFVTSGNLDANIGEGRGIVATSFSDSNIESVGRGEFRLT